VNDGLVNIYGDAELASDTGWTRVASINAPDVSHYSTGPHPKAAEKTQKLPSKHI